MNCVYFTQPKRTNERMKKKPNDRVKLERGIKNKIYSSKRTKNQLKKERNEMKRQPATAIKSLVCNTQINVSCRTGHNHLNF